MNSETLALVPDALWELEIPQGNVAERRTPEDDWCSASRGVLEKSDEVLLGELAEGNREALTALFRRHGQSVLNTAWRVLRERHEADDVRQDVFLYLFQKANLFDEHKGTAISWIIQITYHRAIDRRRYLTSRQHYKHEAVVEDRTPTSQGVPSTDAIDGKSLLNRMREDLSMDQQVTLDLHFFEGYTFREIAEKNGQTVGNIRHHYYRALERLRLGLFPEKRA